MVPVSGPPPELLEEPPELEELEMPLLEPEVPLLLEPEVPLELEEEPEAPLLLEPEVPLELEEEPEVPPLPELGWPSVPPSSGRRAVMPPQPPAPPERRPERRRVAAGANTRAEAVVFMGALPGKSGCRVLWQTKAFSAGRDGGRLSGVKDVKNVTGPDLGHEAPLVVRTTLR
jgi:hypothetical protein